VAAQNLIYTRSPHFSRGAGAVAAVRQISYQDSLDFERYHEDEYRRLGFEPAEVPAGTIEERASLIESFIASRSTWDASWL
jgi:predicted ATPase